MPKLARIALLLAAVLCGGFVVLLGISFSSAVDPKEYAAAYATYTAFWFASGAFIATPFWLPALMPSRFSVTFKVCRFVSAAVLLLHTYLFSSIVVHNISRIISGFDATPSALVNGAVLTVTCIYSIVILLWPWPESRQDG